ncbi:MAG: hypothetical protein M0R70_12810 [Nitrospirae bacterium]|nr:hypothetical protein [Nitrospirota bacterium]
MNEPWKIDEATAIDELQALSKNAKRWLEDRIGNNLASITGYCAIGMVQKVPAVSDKMIEDFNKIGCFELQKIRAGKEDKA